MVESKPSVALKLSAFLLRFLVLVFAIVSPFSCRTVDDH